MFKDNQQCMERSTAAAVVARLKISYYTVLCYCITSCHIIISYCVVLCYIILCHIILYRKPWYDIVKYRISYIILNHMSCFVLHHSRVWQIRSNYMSYIMLYIMLHYHTLCCTVSYHIAVCNDMIYNSSTHLIAY